MDGVRKGVAWKEQEKSGQLHGKSKKSLGSCMERATTENKSARNL